MTPQNRRPWGRFLLCGLLLLASALTLACSDESEEVASTPSDAASAAAVAVDEPAISAEAAQRNADPRPSVVLIVIDTLRADAVSAYGSVEGTTPTIDRLASSGIRYQHAFAPAPWTLASHTTLFTGLRVDQHGVGLAGTWVASDDLTMIAETFQKAGYVTAGFAENFLVSHEFGLDQGFDHFESKDIVKYLKAAVARKGAVDDSFDLVDSVRRWNEDRDKSRPYFVFVNIYDPHDPYKVREVNRWVPSDIPRHEVEYVASQYDIPSAICDHAPKGQDLEILRGLYLGDVAAADAKVADLLDIFQKNVASTRDITIVTADHGEHLGEDRLMGHQFSVRNPVLAIPMVVDGLPDTEPTVIEQAVELRQLHDSILCWALGQSCPASLPISKSMDAAGRPSSEPIFSMYSDSVHVLPTFLLDEVGVPKDQELAKDIRMSCTEEEQVWGDMVSMIRYPKKVIWFEKGKPRFFDLSWDPYEQSDQMEVQPDQAAPMLSELETFARSHVVGRKPKATSSPELDEKEIRALKALGYIE